MPADFRDQLAIVDELLREIARMEAGERRHAARRIDGVPVTGPDWHRTLIARSSRPHDDPPRPAVLTQALADDLLELCEFRHVVRNIYPTRLDEARVRENLARLIRATRAFAAACEAFAAIPAPKRRRARPAPRG